MNTATLLRLAIDSWNGISGEDDSVSSENTAFFAGLYNGPFTEQEVRDALEADGTKVGPIDAEELASYAGAICQCNDIGQRSIKLYTDKKELRLDWRDIKNEYGEWTYAVPNVGMTIYDAMGKSVAFLQGEEGSRLADELELMGEEQVQETLRMYGGEY